LEAVSNSPFADLSIPEEGKVSIAGDVLTFELFNWEYSEFLLFQKTAQEFIRKNRKLKIYIFCNHPHCFTLGRGNERGEEGLVEFNPEITRTLSFPVHSIHRGGGITFHYPGQWIFYPIVSINERYNLDDHMCWLLKSVSSVIRNHYGVEKVLSAKKLMGIWIEKKKLASIGVGMNRFVTEHGLALNLVSDSKMFSELQKINPCGMDSTTYTCLDLLLGNKPEDLVAEFNQEFNSFLVSELKNQ
jgi:lipoyl(octanoyl) transferase